MVSPSRARRQGSKWSCAGGSGGNSNKSSTNRWRRYHVWRGCMLMILGCYGCRFVWEYVQEQQEQRSLDEKDRVRLIEQQQNGSTKQFTATRVGGTTETKRKPAKRPTTASVTHEDDFLIHEGSFGLGHRLSKLAAAYHLAGQVLDLTTVRVDWGQCGSTDIFRHLFGTNSLATKSVSDNSAASTSKTSNSLTKSILVRNDVAGYYAGQAYKNFQLPLTAVRQVQWQSKLDGDRRLFAQLRRTFVGQSVVTKFVQHHRWDDHTVVGVHVRTGNGEQDHFVASGRNGNGTTTNTTSTSSSMEATTALIQALLAKLQEENDATSLATMKPLLVFLATDTANVIPTLAQALRPIPVYTYKQRRVAPGQGVSYSHWTTTSEGTDSNTSTTTNGNNRNDQAASSSTTTTACLDGWMAAATDMMLLARTDVLVATSRSTLTQILPRVTVLERRRWQAASPNRNKFNQNTTTRTPATTMSGGEETNDHRNPHSGLFCEMCETSATCHRTEEDWLYRRHDWDSADGVLHVTTTMDSSEDNPTNATTNREVSPCVHKVMVHLPDDPTVEDPIRDAAQAFLSKEMIVQHENETVFYYGRKYNTRYRQKRKFQHEWA